MPDQPTNPPMSLLPQESTRTEGRAAQRLNIAAARAVADAVRTTLGPHGMDKMLVDPLGSITVTNDGVTILREMLIEQPCARMLVEVASTQEREVGDGTTTAVVLAGELLKNAEHLLERGIHPTLIARGYRLAAEHASDVLARIARPVRLEDHTLLLQIARTAMTGKGVEQAREHLTELVVRAVTAIATRDGQATAADRAAIKVACAVGGALLDSELLTGLLIDKERVQMQMPLAAHDARIALIDTPLEIRNPEIDAKISITDPRNLQGFLDMEEEMLSRMVDRVASSGAMVLACQKGIDDLAAHLLAKHGILALRRVRKSDMDRLAAATGAHIVTDLEDLTPQTLGRAGAVRAVAIGDARMTLFTDLPGSRAATILVRGSTEHVVAEAQRALDDAVGDVTSAIANGRVLAGAGAPELEIARGITAYAATLSEREQLVALAFARAMEVIPVTLAENAGHEPLAALADLRRAHEQGRTWAGVDVATGQAMDAWDRGVLEPLAVKTRALASAIEVATLILRIDDVILAGKPDAVNGPPRGMFGD